MKTKLKTTTALLATGAVALALTACDNAAVQEGDPMDKSTQDPQGADEKSVEDAFKKEQQGVGEDGDKDNPDK